MQHVMSSDEEDGTSVIEEEKNFRNDLASMPLSKVREMKEKLGVKLFNKIYLGEGDGEPVSLAGGEQEELSEGSTSEKAKRMNAKRPREESSKKPVSKRRNVFENERIGRQRIDPRFDESYGKFDEFIYERNYKFVEDMKEEETELLEKELKEAKANREVNRVSRFVP